MTGIFTIPLVHASCVLQMLVSVVFVSKHFATSCARIAVRVCQDLGVFEVYGEMMSVFLGHVMIVKWNALIFHMFNDDGKKVCEDMKL